MSKVLMFADGLYPGTRVTQLVEAVSREFETNVVCLGPDWVDSGGEYGFHVDWFKRTSLLRRYLWLGRLIDRENIRVVWTYGINPLLHVVVARGFRDVKLVMNFMGCDIEVNRKLGYGIRSSRAWDVALRLLVRFPIRFVCMSPFIRDLALDLGLPEHKLVVIPNMFHIDRDFPQSPDPDVQALRQRLSLEDKRVVVSVARHAQTKRVVQLIRAWPGVLKRIPDAVLLLVGTGEMLDWHRQVASELKLNGSVMFVEHVPRQELCTWYGLADVSCNVSDQDAFCNPVVEALTQGTPVVVGPNVGAGRYLIGEPFCKVVDPGDVHSIANGICQMLEGGVKQKHASAAVAKAWEFDVSRVFPLWRALFDEMLAG